MANNLKENIENFIRFYRTKEVEEKREIRDGVAGVPLTRPVVLYAATLSLLPFRSSPYAAAFPLLPFPYHGC